jgi:predicted nucleotidyltransferase
MSTVLDYPIFEKTMNESAYRRREAIKIFVDKLKEEEGNNLLQVILFGSVARDEDHEDSDIDIFILLENYDSTGEETVIIKDRIYDVANHIEDIYKHKVYISPMIRSKKTYTENKQKSLIYYKIANEGVLLYEKKQ